ncbi:hypothetical protein BOG92_002435 [Streptomyces sp. WAC00263]|nr:hypothetical protein BOG92_002435 [Streptomyces sp. WAC00263]
MMELELLGLPSAESAVTDRTMPLYGIQDPRYAGASLASDVVTRSSCMLTERKITLRTVIGLSRGMGT